jgi:hypothetical protein
MTEGLLEKVIPKGTVYVKNVSDVEYPLTGAELASSETDPE